MGRCSLLAFSLLFAIASCSEQPSPQLPPEYEELDSLTVYPADTQPAFDIKLSKERAFPGSEDILIGKILGVEADGNGNIYIADGEQTTIHVFDTTGGHKKKIGRPGRGPGEFGSLPLGNSVKIDGGRLYIYDGRYDRINIFSTETFEYITRISLIGSRDSHMDELRMSSPNLHTVINEELYVIGYFDISVLMERPGPVKSTPPKSDTTFARYYLVNGNGEITGRKIFEAPVPQPYTASDVSRQMLVAVSADKKNLFTAWSEHFLIKIRDLRGNYRRAFYYPYEKVELAPADAPSVKDWEKVPDTWAALSNLIVDDQNRLWVSTVVKNKDIHEWWVLENTGELLARFDWPRDKEIELIKNSKLYTLETEEETGLEEVVRYNISMELWD